VFLKNHAAVEVAIQQLFVKWVQAVQSANALNDTLAIHIEAAVFFKRKELAREATLNVQKVWFAKIISALIPAKINAV
jgi:ketosteroid isomerase-like protein